MIDCFSCLKYRPIFNGEWICDLTQNTVANNGINIANKCDKYEKDEKSNK